jgi:uncharacterized damage-inducible protein DinB
MTAAIDAIAKLPTLLRKEITGLTDEQLDTPYREGGWTIRQVVHHIPDSHLNAYIRIKLALTEENPTIKPFFEERWAEMPDSITTDPQVSLDLLDALHRRWVSVFRNMKPEDFDRTYFHPEQQKSRKLRDILALYAWHGKHHLAHITSLKNRMGW